MDVVHISKACEECGITTLIRGDVMPEPERDLDRILCAVCRERLAARAADVALGLFALCLFILIIAREVILRWD